MKKIVSFVLILMTLVIFTGCEDSSKIIQKSANQEENTVEYKSYVLKWESYGRWNEDIDSLIISNKDELQMFCHKLENEEESYAVIDRISSSLDLFVDYDEQYFKNKSLAILGVDLGSGNQSIDLSKVTREDTKIRIDYEINFSKENGPMVRTKKYIVVEIDKSIIGVTSKCLSPEYSFTDVSLSLKAHTLNSKGATFIIKNNSEKDYNYGADYKIEIKKDGQWNEIELEQPLVWNSLAYKLTSRGQMEINIDFTIGYGELQSGKYRLVKKVFNENDTVTNEMKYQCIYGEFEIL